MLKPIIALMIPLMMITPTNHKKATPPLFIEEVFPVHWKAEMGNMTFRSNYILTPGEIIIGSNGKRYLDYLLRDEKSGVYVINRKNGNIIKHFGNGVVGDMDVTGIVQYNNRIYYGNDNEEFVCATKDGKEWWVHPTSGDVEHEPVLIYHKKDPRIIYATESGEIRAVNPENGHTIWQYYTPDFTGWKPQENRTVFKIKAYFSNTNSFYTKPARADINQDGTDDLLYATRTGDMYAINGANGKIIWKRNDLAAYTIEKDPTTKNSFICVGSYKNTEDLYGNYLFTLNAKGENSPLTKINQEYYSQLSMYFNGQHVLINTNDYLYTFDHHKKIDSVDRKFIGKYQDVWTNEIIENNRNTPGMLFSNRSFTYKNYGKCIFNLVQYDRAYYDKGFLEIISLRDMKVVDRVHLPYDSEMAPSIDDINQDGRLDLLINCRNGNLYCYDLGVPEN